MKRLDMKRVCREMAKATLLPSAHTDEEREDVRKIRNKLKAIRRKHARG
jgi:hypothetical protein